MLIFHGRRRYCLSFLSALAPLGIFETSPHLALFTTLSSRTVFRAALYNLGEKFKHRFDQARWVQ